MNVALWVVQVLLAFHTFSGAVWKFYSPEQAVPSLSAIPHGVWLGISVLELFFAVGLVLPAFNKRLAMLAPISAGCVAAVMVLYCGVHFASGAGFNGQVIYWLVVAAVCAFVMYGRITGIKRKV